MVRASDPRHRRHQDGSVLAGVQVPPPTLAAVLPRASSSALRTHLSGGRSLYVDQHPSGVQPKIDSLYMPRITDAKDLLVQLPIVHSTIVQLLPAAASLWESGKGGRRCGRPFPLFHRPPSIFCPLDSRKSPKMF